jgi:hypothetical protein
MDHDRLFKQLLTTFFVDFVELFLPEVSAYMERDSIKFLDKEVFTDLTAGERHEVDLVVQARFQGADAFFLIHVENQATRQPEFSRRMYSYFSRLHEKFGLPVYPVALFSYDAPLAPEPEQYEVVFPDRRVLLFSYRVIQLNRLNWRDFIRRPNPVAAALMTKMQIKPEDRPKVTLECLRMIVTLKLDLARSALIRDFMTAYLTLTAEQLAVYNQEISNLEPTEKRQIVELKDMWTSDALHHKAIQVAIRLLEHRFGQVSAKLRSDVEQLSDESLDELAPAVMDFATPADAEAWITQRR